MTAFEPWILAYLANSLWQIPLLFAAGWLAARLVRPAGPAAEHRVWTATLLFQLALPIASTFSWQPLWMRFAALFAAHNAGSGYVSVFLSPGIALPPARLPFSLLASIAGAYIVVTAGFVIRFLWRCARLRSLRRSAASLHLPANAALFFSQWCDRLRVTGVSLRSSSRIAGPIALGMRRPLILFPCAMVVDLDPREFETILAHELAHLRRRDFLSNLFCEVIALPIAWHPAVWLAQRRIAESREISCDRMAAEALGSTPYAQSLLRLASRLISGPPLATPHALGIFDTALFERRLMRLTETPLPLNRSRLLATLIVCTALGLAACGSALAFGLHPGAIPTTAAAPPHKVTAVHVAPGIVAGRRISGEMPVYPPDAKKARIQGTVVLHAIIGRKGNVEHLDVTSGPAALQQSSLDAVRTWKYKPFLLNGKAVAVETDITVVYSLEDDSGKTPLSPPPQQKQ